MAVKFLGLSALALTLALTQAPAALACHAMHNGDWVVKVADKLHLDAAQKVKVKAYAHKAKMEIAVKHRELDVICKQINEAFHSGTMNESKLDAFADKITHEDGAIVRIKLQERHDIYQTLSAKQKEKMDSMVHKWEEKHHH